MESIDSSPVDPLVDSESANTQPSKRKPDDDKEEQQSKRKSGDDADDAPIRIEFRNTTQDFIKKLDAMINSVADVLSNLVPQNPPSGDANSDEICNALLGFVKTIRDNASKAARKFALAALGVDEDFIPVAVNLVRLDSTESRCMEGIVLFSPDTDRGKSLAELDRDGNFHKILVLTDSDMDCGPPANVRAGSKATFNCLNINVDQFMCDEGKCVPKVYNLPKIYKRCELEQTMDAKEAWSKPEAGFDTLIQRMAHLEETPRLIPMKYATLLGVNIFVADHHEVF